ncbi:MAG: DUF4336 domain-containing protein [Prochloraceae cyanobacterium]
MLRKIDLNLWVSEQPLKFWQLEVGTRMTIVRFKNDKLIVFSPIQINQKTIQQIDEIGKIAYIIIPNLYHHLFAAEFQAIYPQAELWSVPGLEIKRPDLKPDKILNKNDRCIWDEIEYLFFAGFQAIVDLSGFSTVNEFVFLHKETRTLIITDTAFNFDETFPLKTRLISRAIGSYKTLRPSWLEKIATKDKDKIKRSVQKILNWDFERVIMAHGNIIEKDGKEKFKRGYEWFLETSL